FVASSSPRRHDSTEVSYPRSPLSPRRTSKLRKANHGWHGSRGWEKELLSSPIRVIRTPIKQILRRARRIFSHGATRNHTEKSRKENNVPKSASLPRLSGFLSSLKRFS